MPGNTAHEYEVRESINQVAEASRKFVDTDERPVQRDQHPKQHGCVRARFVDRQESRRWLPTGVVSRSRRSTKPGSGSRTAASVTTAIPTPMAWPSSSWVSRDRRFSPVSGTPRLRTSCWSINPTFFLRDAAEYARYSDVLLKASGQGDLEPVQRPGVLRERGGAGAPGAPASFPFPLEAPDVSAARPIRQQANRQSAHDSVLEHHTVQVRRYVHEVFGRAG